MGWGLYLTRDMEGLGKKVGLSRMNDIYMIWKNVFTINRQSKLPDRWYDQQEEMKRV